MSTRHPRPWHKDSQFGDGPRVPMCRERRAVWKVRIEIFRRAGRITDGYAYVALALLRRVGQDGRCDPSHRSLASDSGESEATVKRALTALRGNGLVWWVRRLARDGWRCVQISNAYQLMLGEPPKIPAKHCEVQSARETLQEALNLTSVSGADVTAAQKALAERRQVIEGRLLNKDAAA